MQESGVRSQESGAGIQNGGRRFVAAGEARRTRRSASLHVCPPRSLLARPSFLVPRHASRAFTLIELLVAMSILVVIVLIVSQIFAQATIAWNTGSRKAEMNMTGRAVADFIAQDLSQAVLTTNYAFNVPNGGSTASFWYLGDATNATRGAGQVTYGYSGNAVTRNGQAITDTNILGLVFLKTDFLGGGVDDLPLYVDVQVTVSDNAPKDTSNKVFESRAEFPNRNRYRF